MHTNTKATENGEKPGFELSSGNKKCREKKVKHQSWRRIISVICEKGGELFMLFTWHNKSKIVANKFIIVDYLQPALHKGSRLPTLTKAKNCLPDAELTLGIQQFININTRAATINYQNKKKSNVGEG